MGEVTRAPTGAEVLASAVTAAEAGERRVAEALHAGALQDVLVARQELLELTDQRASDNVERALRSLEVASMRLREAIFELHPVVVDHLDLASAVEHLAGAVAERSGIAVTAVVDAGAPHSADPVVLGVIREALSNSVRHAHAQRAWVTVTYEDDAYVVDVVDDGIGLSPESAEHHIAGGRGGLAVNRARVEVAGGTLAALASEGGTHIRSRVPR